MFPPLDLAKTEGNTNIRSFNNDNVKNITPGQITVRQMLNAKSYITKHNRRAKHQSTQDHEHEPKPFRLGSNKPVDDPKPILEQNKPNSLFSSLKHFTY